MLKLSNDLKQQTAPDDRQAFFDAVRGSLFSGSLNQNQVDGLDALLTAVSPFTLPQQAYILATAYHETGITKRLPDGRRIFEHTMQPVREMDKGAGRRYGTWQTNSKGVRYCYQHGGNGAATYTEAEYPHLYYGRGHVQLTWLCNYLRAGKALGAMLDDAEQLAREPDLALRPDISAAILCLGMRDGWFTGKKLDDYINSRQTDYVNARRIVNGTDKAALIAGHARKFQAALEAVA